MNNTEIINGLLKQITDGLSLIMEQSFPFCKSSDSNFSSASIKINNTAFELKKMTVLLQNQINFTKQ